MSKSAEHYRDQLLMLLPNGIAWPKHPDSVPHKVQYALGEEFARIDVRSFQLLEEADPRTTQEMFGDWERAYGLPDPCMALDESLEVRRKLLVRKVIGWGKTGRDFFVEFFAELGIDITITEWSASRYGTPYGGTFGAVEWDFVWQVDAEELVYRGWRYGERHGGPYRIWDTGIIECIVRRLKPAHTFVLFNYGEA